ncbi:uncharacterized protein LOC121621283 [Chelmon rostratus]|uniref:uncharacterized protein LOC121621283 n=1 Tax=Chelmon rostratus TaxID=109905 RepID=UPI001BE7AE48|nr:uncharacterized protein LOC121621283 [Chelmon rostratus]
MRTLSSGSEHTHCFGASQRKLRTCKVISFQQLPSCAPQAQAALSSASGPTMPQPTQQFLIHVLLLWTTILSIIQAVFIIIVFTSGHRSLNSSPVAPARTVQFQANNTPSPPPPDYGLLLGKGQMITYRATAVNGAFKWEARNPSNELVSEDGKDLQIKKDGYYFVYLQVTLKSSKCPCNETGGLKSPVNMTWNNDILLQGGIQTSTCSTGLLGKAQVLSGGGKLVFQLPTCEIDETEYLTHLDIIYMRKP